MFISDSNIWLLPERRRSSLRQRAPVQLTRGPLAFYDPSFSPDGRTLFAVGVEWGGQLVRYDPRTNEVSPYLSGIAARWLAFSPDGQWISYSSIPDNSLWRCRRDGRDRVLLASPGGHSRWSPDGRRIAFDGWTAPGKFPKIALISRDGGSPEQVVPESEFSGQQEDPTWSPDGQQIIFGGTLPSGRLGLMRVDLQTKMVTAIPGSEGLYSPRWSPDGRYLAALTEDEKHLMLFNFRTKFG